MGDVYLDKHEVTGVKSAAACRAKMQGGHVLIHMADTRGSASQHHQWQRGFWSLILTQFQGAFSDNALKNLVLFLVIGAGISQAKQESINSQVLVLFSLPFILFSMYGGFFADRFSKRSVTI